MYFRGRLWAIAWDIYRHQFIIIIFFLISVSSHVEKCTVGFKVLHSLHDRPQYTTRLILRDTVRFGSSPALDAWTYSVMTRSGGTKPPNDCNFTLCKYYLLCKKCFEPYFDYLTLKKNPD